LPPLCSHGELVCSDLDKANVLNKTFVQHFVKDNDCIPRSSIDLIPPDLSDVSFTPDAVLLAITSFKKSKSIGPDNFSSYYYNEIKYQICKPLSVIFTASYKSGCLPASWKLSRVVPIYKKGNAADPENYRPIAMTSFPCRVMEKIIKGHMLAHVWENNIILSDQYGFLQGRSTSLMHLKLLDDWTMDGY